MICFINYKVTTFCTHNSLIARVTSIGTGSINLMTLFFSKTFPTLFMAILAKRPITAHYKSNTLFLTGNKWRFKHINNVDKYCEACWLIVSLHYLFYTGLNSQKYKHACLYVEYFETWCWRTGNIMLLFDNKLFYI